MTEPDATTPAEQPAEPVRIDATGHTLTVRSDHQHDDGRIEYDVVCREPVCWFSTVLAPWQLDELGKRQADHRSDVRLLVLSAIADGALPHISTP